MTLPVFHSPARWGGGALRAVAHALFGVVALVAAVGCESTLSPLPNLCACRDPSPIASVPETRRSSTVPIIFATDRRPVEDSSGRFGYSWQRSKSLAFGLAEIEFGQGLSWDKLVGTDRRSPPLEPVRLFLRSVDEVGRFAPTPIPLVDGPDGSRIPDPAIEAEDEVRLKEFHELIRSQLLPEDDGRVTVFVHGYNNTFQDAMFVAAQVSHFTARRGLVIAYSWPAGLGGLRGYTHDRESGEFTVYHLRKFLRMVASSPDVKKMNVLAHSRGTDVAITAVREVNMIERAAGRNTRDTLKLGHLILAAPDIDLDVVSQRISTEYLYLVPESTTIYFCGHDRAIGIADWLFASALRLGGLRFDRMDPELRKALNESPPTIGMIDVHAHTGFLGHSYFYQSPAVSSDIYLVLMEDRMPGAEHGRPLHSEEPGVWILKDGYPDPPRSIFGSSEPVDDHGDGDGNRDDPDPVVQ